MAFESPIPGGDLGEMVAAVNLGKADQFLAVALNAQGQVVAQSVAGAQCLGVLQNDPSQGQPASVRVTGVSKVQAGAALTVPGTILMSNASGQAVAWTTGNARLGVQLDTAPAVGDLVSVFVAL